jgi:hypothetical protein
MKGWALRAWVTPPPSPSRKDARAQPSLDDTVSVRALHAPSMGVARARPSLNNPAASAEAAK